MHSIFRSFLKVLRKLGLPVGRGTHRRLRIQPYRGYGNHERVYLKARVLEEKPLRRGPGESRWRNLINSYKRFETDEVPGIKVSIQVGEQRIEETTDHEGYIDVEISGKFSVNANQIWQSVVYSLPETAEEKQLQPVTEGEFLLPNAESGMGIVSDIDDTILQTHITSRFRWRMLYDTFFKSARRREPMEGTDQLFRDLVAGTRKQPANPIFYVSHSPWNLYDVLTDFLDHRGFPKGPVFLRDYGIRPQGPFSDHKIYTISRILETYPNLPFILLGDTGSKDADFYLELARRYPGRIKAIYIRQTSDSRNARRIGRLLEQATETEAVLIRESEEIREHARRKGWIL